MFTADDERAWLANGMLMVPRQYRAAADHLRAQGQEQLAKTAEALIKLAEHWLRKRQRGPVPSVHRLLQMNQRLGSQESKFSATSEGA